MSYYRITREVGCWTVWQDEKAPAISNHPTIDAAEAAVRRYTRADARREETIALTSDKTKGT